MKRQPSIAIVDYNVGNTYSVYTAIKSLSYSRLKISSSINDLKKSDIFVLPGVGAFAECAKNLKERGLDQLLYEQIIIQKKPIIGICVGMQLMANSSEENGKHDGLGWIPGVVKRLMPGEGFTVPHVGWNDIKFETSCPLFPKFSPTPNFYFDHSYHFKCDQRFIVAECEYGSTITAAVQLDNIFGVQFHPEKSHNSGLRLFRNFFNWAGQC